MEEKPALLAFMALRRRRNVRACAIDLTIS
jgi:hypothetical protein